MKSVKSAVLSSPVILSVAKDLIPASTGDVILRYAQDD